MGLVLSMTTETTALCVGLGLYACLYLYVKLHKGKCHSKKTLEGKTIIVTGANSGIGFETALNLANRNGRVILACRNLERVEAARNKIVQLTGNTEVVCRQVDLSVMSSIRKFVDVIKKEEGTVDILINNAGVVNFVGCCPQPKTPTSLRELNVWFYNHKAISFGNKVCGFKGYVYDFSHEFTDLHKFSKKFNSLEKIFTEEGLELTFATNHFGPFLLTTLLKDMIKRSRGRIVNVGSAASVIGKVDCDNLRAEKEFSQLQYHNSKAANLLFTKELARREPDVLVCCVHPGTVRTDVFRHMPLPVKILVSTVFRVLTKSPAEGVQPVLFCALDDSVQTGGYYMDCAQYDHTMWVPKCAYDTGLAKKLWETTERILSECG